MTRFTVFKYSLNAFFRAALALKLFYLTKLLFYDSAARSVSECGTLAHTAVIKGDWI